MFSPKQRNTHFNSPLDQFSAICREVLDSLGKMNKAFKDRYAELLLLFMLLPRKVNFTQLGKFGDHGEQCYRQTFAKEFDHLAFNIKLSQLVFEKQSRKAIAIDPSYISKSGKKTPGIGYFWSGCAGAVKRGLEIMGIGLLDVDRHDCMPLNAVQTPNPKSLAEAGLNLRKWYALCISNNRDKLTDLSCYIVADAYFATRDFADAMERDGFHLVCRFRDDANLRYIYTPDPAAKRGRGKPKQFDGKIDVRNLDLSRMERIPIYEDEGDAYTMVAYSVSLKRKVRLVIFRPKSGNAPKLYFSTDTSMSGRDVIEYYRCRFQIEFAFRDAKQYTGLCDCQSRDLDTINFAFNTSLSALGVAKVYKHRHDCDLSIGGLKSLFYNYYLLQRILCKSGNRPNKSLNAQIFKELFVIAAPAA